MSIIHVNQIASKIRGLFADKLDLSDLSPSDKEYDPKVLTRCLAAYAIYSIGGTSEADAAAAVVDGGEDNGIDAVYYSPVTKRMVIVQSKWKRDGNGEPESSETRKFKDGVFDLVNLNLDRFNAKVVKKQSVIEAALGEFDTKFDLVLIHTGSQSLSMHSQRVIDDLLNELNDAGDGENDDVVTFHHLNQATIHSSLASGLDGEPIDLEIGLSQWGKLEEPHLAFYGMVAGEEVANWWANKGKRLFSKNIRQMLGATEVNDEVKSTLEQCPDHFWYFNNGITLVADTIKKSMVGGNGRDIGSFKATNVSIVNGAQTVSVIGRYKLEAGQNLERVRVPIRLISLEGADVSFGANVTKTNNRQNRIENRDFVSLDEQQIRLRSELAIEGIDYNIVRSENFKPSNLAIDLSEATVALACCTGQASMAVQAKREIGKFFENLTKAPYKTIFNPNTTGIFLRNVVLSLRKIDEALGRQTSELLKRSGKKYGVLIHGNRFITMLVFKKLNIERAANDYSFDTGNYDWDAAVNEVVEKVIAILTKSYNDKILGTLFKNATICKSLAEECS